MFGNNNSSNTQGNAFGGNANNNNNASQNTTFSFGSSNTNPTTNAFGQNAKPSGGFSFGAGSNNQQSQPSSSLFGAPKTTGFGSAFGANTDANKSQTTSNQASTFGQTGSNANATSAGGFTFGKKDESPAATSNTGGASNTGGIFGVSNSGHSIAPQQQQQQTTSGFGSFTNPQSSTPSNTFGGVFGQKKDDSQEKKPAFGFGTSNSSSNVFGPTQTGSGAGGAFSVGEKKETPTAPTNLFDAKKDESSRAAPTSTSTSDFQFPGSQQPKASSPFGTAANNEAEKMSQSPMSIGGTASPKPGSTLFGFGAKKGDTTEKPMSGASFSFGKKDEVKDKPASGSLFGTSGGKPAAANKDDGKDKQTGGFSFGAKKDEDKDKPAGGFSFGANKDDDKDKPAGGFSFGAKKDEDKDKQTGGFSFGAKKDEDKDKPAGGFSFGAKKDEDKDKQTGGFSFGAKKDEGETKKEIDAAKIAPPSSSTTTSTSDTSQPNLKPTKIQPIPVSIDNKNLDDLILKWSKQLSSTAKLFHTYTDKVKTWDLKLVESGDAITKLNQESIEVQALESKIDQQLRFVENQQDELEKVLDNYEQQTDILLSNIEVNNNSGAISSGNVPAITGGANTSTHTAGVSASSSALTTRDDTQHQQQQLQPLVPTSVSLTDKLREKAYYNAELLDERLDTLGENLNTLITEVNSIGNIFNKSLAKNLTISDAKNNKEGKAGGDSKDQDKNSDGYDRSIEEIIQLLNLHLENLKFIENAEAVLKKKLAKVK
ncbi:Nucleoporin nsp1 [Candida parapsilosis]|nr:Nucleoporin nsp1 [Candida parapsilosis]